MRFKKVKVNQTKLCWNEQDLYFHQKTIREYSVKHDSFFHTCLTFCKYVWEKPNLCVKYHTCSFWQMFDFYPTCLEKTKHVGIFTPGCYFPHMFGFWHIGMGKGTHVCKKPHNYMFANVWHFPHMCGKSHWHAYFPLSYGWGVKTTWTWEEMSFAFFQWDLWFQLAEKLVGITPGADWAIFAKVW